MQMLLIAAALFAGADTEPDALPKGPPPRVAVLSAKELMVTYVTYEQVPVTKQVKVRVIEGGKAVDKIVTLTETVMTPRTVQHLIKDIKATTAGGKRLDSDAAAKALASPRVVLISSDGKPVDPAYLKLCKPDTPVLVLPTSSKPP